jgi:hypothetical protein
MCERSSANAEDMQLTVCQDLGWLSSTLKYYNNKNNRCFNCYQNPKCDGHYVPFPYISKLKITVKSDWQRGLEPFDDLFKTKVSSRYIDIFNGKLSSLTVIKCINNNSNNVQYKVCLFRLLVLFLSFSLWYIIVFFFCVIVYLNPLFHSGFVVMLTLTGFLAAVKSFNIRN